MAKPNLLGLNLAFSYYEYSGPCDARGIAAIIYCAFLSSAPVLSMLLYEWVLMRKYSPSVEFRNTHSLRSMQNYSLRAKNQQYDVADVNIILQLRKLNLKFGGVIFP